MCRGLSVPPKVLVSGRELQALRGHVCRPQEGLLFGPTFLVVAASWASGPPNLWSRDATPGKGGTFPPLVPGRGGLAGSLRLLPGVPGSPPTQLHMGLFGGFASNLGYFSKRVPGSTGPRRCSRRILEVALA